MTRPLAVVLHDRVDPGAPPDRQDTLGQVRELGESLGRLGYSVVELSLNRNLEQTERSLRDLAPDLVVNLAETPLGDGRLVYLPALMLERLGLPFSGCGSRALYLAADKILAKRLLRGTGLPTPDWRAVRDLERGGVPHPGPWLVKSVWEEASIGLDTGALVWGETGVLARIAESARRYGGEWLAERYVEGREFNVALLADRNGPGVLPLAEMCFFDYPPGVPRILDYAAKWDPDSFGYRNTVRRFDSDSGEASLRAELTRLALASWELFDLRGYARVDFRVDTEGRPWILEVNANPCLSADAGFMAAAGRAGLDLDQVLNRIIAAAGGGTVTGT